MPLNPDSELAKLMATLPQVGTVQWIGLRPARDEDMTQVESVEATAEGGLRGDRYKGGSGKRGITLIQAEHLPAIAALSGRDIVPALLRRSVGAAGLRLVAVKARPCRTRDAAFEGTEPCDPCSRMEAALGPGGYNAMRGMGGLCARIVSGGSFKLGDKVVAL